MNTGQTLITIGALFLLSMVILNVNNGFLNTGASIMETKFDVMAVSLATSIIEEANSKAFDNATDTTSITTTTPLKNYNQLGPESGEVYPNYNDFDDYNGYSRLVVADTTLTPLSEEETTGVETIQVDSTFRSANLRLDCLVDYITVSSNTLVSTSSKTWHKRLRVTVTSRSMKDTVRMQTVFSYWYFR